MAHCEQNIIKWKIFDKQKPCCPEKVNELSLIISPPLPKFLTIEKQPLVAVIQNICS